MSALLVVAVCIPVALFFALFAYGRGQRRNADRVQRDADDRAFLLLAPRLCAKILRSEQDGLTNLKPSFRLVLRIDAPDGAYPVETNQYVEYSDVHRVRVGRMIDVQFDPKKRDRVSICSHDIESAHAPVDDRSEATFLAAAVRIKAKILSVSEIPQVSVDMPGLAPSLWLSLDVEAPDGAYVAGTCVQSVGIRRLEVGDRIAVWVEPNNHDRLELDHGDLVAKG